MAIHWRDKLPDMVLGKARAAGEAGVRWLETLDDIIRDLERRWNIRVTDVLNGGSHAFVGTATDANDCEYILKIDIPDCPEEDFLRSAAVLHQAGGRGYCRMFAGDARHRALLLERLGETMRQSALSPTEQMTILCRAMKEGWQPPTEELKKYCSIGNAAWFRDFIGETWESLGRPCPEKIVRTALSFVRSLEEHTVPAEYVMVHGDAHNNNMLRVPGSDQYKFIDPDGLIFEKSYDVGVLMREWPEEFEPAPLPKGRERCEFLSALTGVDSRDIWEWGFLQMTATALILLQIGQQELGMRMLRIAEAWC